MAALHCAWFSPSASTIADGDGRILQTVRALQRWPVGLHRQETGAIDAVDVLRIAPRRFPVGDLGGLGIADAEHRVLIGPLHGEQAALGCGIGGEIGVAVEMIRGDVEQGRDFAGKVVRQVDLVARQLEDIDAARRQRLLGEDGNADIAGHAHRQRRAPEQVVDQRRGGRFAVGAGNAYHPVRRQTVARKGEELDVADHRHPRSRRCFGDRMPVERHPGRDHNPIVSGKIDRQRIGQLDPAFDRMARFLAAVPRGQPGAARQQALDRGHARTGKSEHRVALAGEGG